MEDPDYGYENEEEIPIEFGKELQEFVVSVGNLFNKACVEFMEDNEDRKTKAAEKIINLLTEMLQAFLETSTAKIEISEVQEILKLSLTYLIKL